MPQQPQFAGESPGTLQPSQDARTVFVYPYNFVPHGGPRRGSGQTEGIGTDQPFKPLHRLDGLTGRIEYTLVTLSPLFVADSEGITIYKLGPGDEQWHRVMDFFNVDGRLCLPGTSLKGAIRSAVEAASNSTMGVAEEHNKRFTYRKVTNIQNRRWGKWTAARKIQPWGMAKLPLSSLSSALAGVLGKTPTNDELFDLQHQSVQVRLWKIHTGIPVVAAFELNGTWHNGLTVPAPAAVPFSSGMFRARPAMGYKRMIESASAGVQYNCPWDGEVTQRFQGASGGPLAPGKAVQFKAATFPELNFGGTRTFGNNRVFEISYGGRTWSAIDPNPHSGELLFHKNYLEPGVQKSDRYVRVLYQMSSSALDVPQDVIDAYIAASRELPEVDSIVYYERPGGSNAIAEFGPVAVFRSAERRPPRNLFRQASQFFSPTSPDLLCPATRLFGWTPESEDEGGGVAGRVRLSMAWSDKDLHDTRLIPLKILGSPKPQYYPFYLKPTDGQDPSTKAAYYTDHHESPWAQVPGTPRGRKMYLHHPNAIGDDPDRVLYVERTAAEISQESREKDPDWLHSHQNSTCAVLPPGATFRGVIEFESLDANELGLLLWALTFTDNPLQVSQAHAHKLGMGKGIGMGSVRFHLERVMIQEPEKAWVDLQHPDAPIDLEAVQEQTLDAEALLRLVRRFKTWMVSGKDEDNLLMAAHYDACPFVRDLLAVTRVDLVPPDVPIQYYPRYWREERGKPVRRWYADEGYTYFVHQRQKRADNREEPLRTPTAIQQGHRQGIV